MSKTLTILWDNPIPHSECGYKAFYRRNTDSSYTELTTSGATSGTTSISTIVTAPACFEGYTVSDCCADNLSTPDPFGINSYVPFSIDITINTDGPIKYLAEIASEYPNTYDTYISGSFIDQGGILPITMAYTAIYPSGSTSAAVVLPGTPSVGHTIIQVDVSGVTASYDNGGDIQQYNSLSTPPYFQFVWDQSSGVTWNGSPASLPSMVLLAFNPTEVDEDDNTLAGNLLISWIYDTLYADGVSPYDFVTLEIYDLGDNLLGTTTFSTTPVGLRNITILMTRADEQYPLIGTDKFKMISKWNDETIIEDRSFYLPIP